MGNHVGRRHLLAGASAAFCLSALGGCATPLTRDVKQSDAGGLALPLPRIHASIDRLTQITVCLRPFRAQGPRLEVEQIGDKTVVHNYGHGGSGWSLSWGAGALATEKVMATGQRDIAVIGCGAIGLTTALQLQRAGAHVTIYSKDMPPQVRSSLASGVWSPDSRICLDSFATPDFKQQWERMCRLSFTRYQSLLGLAGAPVEFIDSYFVADNEEARRKLADPVDGKPPFAALSRELVGDLSLGGEKYAPGSHPLGPHYLRRSSILMFNIPSYSRLLMSDFLANGGQIEITEFHGPAEFARLRQKTLVNCTGYGARALLNDSSVIPVRGQLARLVPQPDVNYGLYYKGVSYVPRRDGAVCQVVGDDDYYGYNNDNLTPDRAEAEQAINSIAALSNGI